MPKQEELGGVEGPGVSPVKIKAVDNAFDELLSAREKRMSYGEKEGEASAVLVELFRKHDLRSYTFDDKKYVLSEICKVKKAPKDEPEDE